MTQTCQNFKPVVPGSLRILRPRPLSDVSSIKSQPNADTPWQPEVLEWDGSLLFSRRFFANHDFHSVLWTVV